MLISFIGVLMLAAVGTLCAFFVLICRMFRDLRVINDGCPAPVDQPDKTLAEAAKKWVPIKEERFNAYCGHCGHGFPGDPDMEVVDAKQSFLVYHCLNCLIETRVSTKP
jgi:hypothetical protein